MNQVRVHHLPVSVRWRPKPWLTWTCACLLAGLSCTTLAQQPSGLIRGLVVSRPSGQPLSDIHLQWIKDSASAVSDPTGHFSIRRSELPSDTLILSALGWTSQKLPGSSVPSSGIRISLDRSIHELSGLTVSSGYQNIPLERSTGSYDFIGPKAFQSRETPDVLSRLEGLASGLVFNPNSTSSTRMTIRGLSTIYANADPLIILDNFPYSGSLEDINPNDVASISILKDAAASSIWGARAGNGAIVITTKQGAFHQPLQVSMHSSMTSFDRQNMFYKPQMSSSDYIDVETQLFQNGYYKSTENSPYHYPLSPAVELLIQQRDGILSSAAFQTAIGALRVQDVRKDYAKYFLRKGLAQQQALTLSGGSGSQHYYASLGYDQQWNGQVGNQNRRYTLDGKETVTMAHHRLQADLGYSYVQNEARLDGIGLNDMALQPGKSVYPYARLADALGHPLAITKDYRESFKQQSEQLGLLNWDYVPLEELKNAQHSAQRNDIRLQGGLTLKLLPGLSLQGQYQFEHLLSTDRNDHSLKSYYTRDLINQYTQVSAGNDLSHPLPVGDILDESFSQMYGQNLRIQGTYDKRWTPSSHLVLLAGWEVQDNLTYLNDLRYYGYNPDNGTDQKTDYVNTYKLYVKGYGVSIPYANDQNELRNRYLSGFSNASYTYRNAYTVSASARLDQSNLFGVRTNQRGVPLWSAGLGWILSESPLLRNRVFPFVKLRLTYGYSGNVDPNITAYTTALIAFTSFLDGRPYGLITNPPNPELRWERDRMMNAGLDFESARKILSGSIDVYRKQGFDLIGYGPVPPSTGSTQAQQNLAGSKGWGLDANLSSHNLKGSVGWNSRLLFSIVHEVVSHYEGMTGNTSLLQFGSSSIVPLEGKPVYAVFALPWAGLDPRTGDPQGYLDGKPSTNYYGILKATPADSLKYMGPATPTVFGNLGNEVRWRGWSLNVDISYRLGYYYRKSSINYSSLVLGNVGSQDYERRWQKPGDEAHTQVPSMPYKVNAFRDLMYLYSDQLVRRADNIRLQDIRLAYQVPMGTHGSIHALELFAYAHQLGLLWKASKDDSMDPDYPLTPALRSYSLGLNVTF